MSKVTFTPILPKKLNINVYVTTLMNALKAEAAEHRKQLNKTIKGWNDPPTMKTEILVIGNDTVSRTRPTGTEKQVKKWGWINEGTKKHKITAKNVPTLRFQEGYTARTTPKQFSSGKSSRFGEWVTPVSVNNPGITAREWTKTLEEQRKGPFKRRMENAMKWAAFKSFFS